MGDQSETAALRAALTTLIERLDNCRRVERGAGGMSIDAQFRRTELVGVRAIWVEEARDALDGLEATNDAR